MILETKGISKSFDSIQALQNVDVKIESSEIFGIAGPNGAGKSTLFNVIAGVYRPTNGKVYFEGRDITRLGPHRICHLGLARTFQVPKTFPTLTVYDNVRVGATFGGHKRPVAIQKTIDSTLRFLGINVARDTLAANLDLYTAKLVGLAMVLATECKLLMLDEPLAGLAINEIEDFLGVIRKINKEQETTIIMIEHILDALIDISDRMLVLDNGEVIYTGAPEKVSEDQRVIDCYLGKVEA
jgi:branched-chain amino acid transport system ATP-binding protein